MALLDQFAEAFESLSNISSNVMDRLKEIVALSDQLNITKSTLETFTKQLEELPERHAQETSQSLNNTQVDNLITIKNELNKGPQQLEEANKELEKLVSSQASEEEINRQKEKIDKIKQRNKDLEDYLDDKQHLLPQKSGDLITDEDKKIVREALEQEKRERQEKLNKLLGEELENVSEKDKFNKRLAMAEIEIIGQLRLTRSDLSFSGILKEAKKELEKINEKYDKEAQELQDKIKQSQEEIARLEQTIGGLTNSETVIIKQPIIPPIDIKNADLKTLEESLKINQEAVKANSELAKSVLSEPDLKFHAIQNLMQNEEARKTLFGTGFKPFPDSTPEIIKNEKNNFDIKWKNSEGVTQEIKNVDVAKLKNFARNNIINLNKPYHEDNEKIKVDMKELFDNTRKKHKEEKNSGDIVVNMNNLIALAKAREALFSASPKASREYEEEIKQKAGVSQRHSKAGDMAKNMALGLAGLKLSVEDYREKKQSAFSAKQDALKFRVVSQLFKLVVKNFDVFSPRKIMPLMHKIVQMQVHL